MYEILRQSMLNLNHHIDVTGAYAGNARLFEATGVGTLLITDWKQKFAGHARAGQGGRLAIALPRNALKWSSYYLEHDEKRETIARAGQQRSLRDRTYYRRMPELADIVQKYL